MVMVMVMGNGCGQGYLGDNGRRSCIISASTAPEGLSPLKTAAIGGAEAKVAAARCKRVLLLDSQRANCREDQAWILTPRPAAYHLAGRELEQGRGTWPLQSME